eukprot:scaffold20295_cov164-Isochrysis_galbana.AAC.1
MQSTLPAGMRPAHPWAHAAFRRPIRKMPTPLAPVPQAPVGSPRSLFLSARRHRLDMVSAVHAGCLRAARRGTRGDVGTCYGHRWGSTGGCGAEGRTSRPGSWRVCRGGVCWRRER